MSYIKAEDILPRELIEEIQKYVDGRNIYIPCKEKQDWGSKTDTRQFFRERNRRAFRGSLETRETAYGKRQNKSISVCSYFFGFVCVSDMIEWSVGFCIGSGNKDKRGKTS